jgi:hypothetical protein
MPWTTTTEFTHPLANFINTNKQSRATTKETANYMSYLIVEWLTWQGSVHLSPLQAQVP